jgi:hypothetical protein
MIPRASCLDNFASPFGFRTFSQQIRSLKIQ